MDAFFANADCIRPVGLLIHFETLCGMADMKLSLIALVSVIVLLIGGAVALVVIDVPVRQETVEKTIPNEQFVR